MSEATLPQADRATALQAEQYAAAYPPGIGRHYWHVARNKMLWKRLASTLRPGSVVLDIGCGPGILVEFLRDQDVDCQGSDLGQPIPESSRVAPHLHLGTDAFELDAALREKVDTILLMDVLEHLGEPSAFLVRCREAFPNLRTIHLTVPARMEIWSNYDEYFGHFRRYTRSALREVAQAADLQVEGSSYAFHGLYAAARAVGLISKKRATKLAAPGAPPVHSVLGALFAAEDRVLPTWMKGSSIFAQLRVRRRVPADGT